MSDDKITLDLGVRNQKGRYMITKSGYVFDRAPFRLYCLLFFVIAMSIVIVSYVNGTEVQAWVNCPDDAIGGWCENPLHGKCDLPACQKDKLLAGEEIGTKPDYSLMERFTISLLGVLFVLLLINHLFQKSERYEDVRTTHKKQNKKGKRSFRTKL
jgi:hypothetical protein